MYYPPKKSEWGGLKKKRGWEKGKGKGKNRVRKKGNEGDGEEGRL